MNDRPKPSPAFDAIRAAILRDEAKPTAETFGMLDDSLRRQAGNIRRHAIGIPAGYRPTEDVIRQAGERRRREWAELMDLGRELVETMRRTALATERNTAALEANTAALVAATPGPDEADSWKDGSDA